MKLRGEIVERSFAHCYESGGMRRVHLRGRGNIIKRLLIHVGGFNLSLIMRQLFGYGTPRGLSDALARARERLRDFIGALCAFFARTWPFSQNQPALAAHAEFS
jgi:hypothetical protein